MEKNYTYIDLLDRYISGRTSLEEEKRLLEWFGNPDSEKEITSFYRQKWEEASRKELPVEIQGRMFHEIKNRMKQPEKAEILREKSYNLRKWLSYVAVMLICMGLGVGSYLYTRQVLAPVPEDCIVLADKGQRASVILPDGTKVWLNSHTRLAYDTDYGKKERFVSLSGEAYFEVAKDKEHRFVVQAGNLEVEALGTSFNVKAYEEDNEMIATLFEGSVRAKAGNEMAVLAPDQCAIFNKTNHRLSVNRPRNTSYASLWRMNELAFSGESLEDIAVLLDRMYNVEVRFLSNKIRKYRFSGIIRNNSLDNVFEIISLTAPITYESVGDTIYLSEK